MAQFLTSQVSLHTYTGVWTVHNLRNIPISVTLLTYEERIFHTPFCYINFAP